jgi:hypothetical protein
MHSGVKLRRNIKKTIEISQIKKKQKSKDQIGKGTNIEGLI